MSMISSLGGDLRRALRVLRNRPTFAFATVLTLALGIGATTAIFSVVHSVLIKPLPYPNPDELVRIRHRSTAMNVDDLTTATTQYFTYRDENRTLAQIGVWQESGQTLVDRGEPERLRSLLVSYGLLQALGVQPTTGRWFSEQEHEPSAEGPQRVILSYAFWQRRFGGDEAVLDREISIDSRPSRVVGIMPRDFRFLDLSPQPDVMVPWRLDRSRLVIGNFDAQALARLKPGVTPAEARADIERILPIWMDAWPLIPGIALTRETIANWRIAPIVTPLKEDLVGNVASTLWVLMGAIGAVLLVACANIANLMLVRADARRQEFAVRAALGAVPARIARELLVESLVVGVAGGVFGLLLAYAGLQALIAIGPSNLPRLQEISIDPAVLAFCVAVSLASTLVFGSFTALKHARGVDAAVIGGARGSSASRERNATRNTLVVVQVALAIVLVVSAALMIRTFQALRDVDPGFSEPATIQTARIWMPTTPTPDPARDMAVQHEILDKIAALPGVTAAGLTSLLPMENGQIGMVVLVEGQTLPAGAAPQPRRFKFVSPGYLEAMGTRVIAGRDLTWSDIDAGGRVALISESFARELAPDPASALGKRIRPPLEQDDWREVVGIVQDVHDVGVYEDAPNLVYWPALRADFFGRPLIGMGAGALVIRSERAGIASFADEIRQTIWSVNASMPVTSGGTMQDLYAASLARTSFALVLLAIAGGMALLLGIIGIYGVIAYVVSQRTREIGIRAALGAEPRQLARMFLLHGLKLGAVGAALGIVAAATLGRSMQSLLFGVSALDPAAYLGALAVIIGATALATYVPARRAAGIDPMETLKQE
jgi:putative ABC transport system permease protein